MSEYTICNYCTLKGIKARAKKDKKKVKVVANRKYGGLDVIVDGKVVAWLMELTDRCCC